MGRNSRSRRSSSGGGKRGGCCKAITALVVLGAIGGTLWVLLGKPTSLDDAKDGWNNLTGSLAGALESFREKWGNIDWENWNDFGNMSAVLDRVDDFEDVWDKDPFVGDNTTYLWPTEGRNGLALTILNAMNSSWDEAFQAAFNDWNAAPALILTEVPSPLEYECKPVDGKMKSCAGNYGETGWLGINEIAFRDGNKIINSIAKMNEFYLLNAEAAARQYTVCHEFGHGFGLPHDDEQFGNKDLGTCMDYTNNYQNNISPNSNNFRRLQEMYGTPDGEGGRNLLRGGGGGRGEEQQNVFGGAMTEHEHRRYSQLMDEFHNEHASPSSSSGWRLLRERGRRASYSRKLTAELTLQVNVLYAHPETGA